jgi:hypothetical protein
MNHEGIRQNLIKVSDEVKVLLQRERNNKESKESPRIIFVKVDGLYASLQKQSRSSTEETVGVIHTGWASRSECRGEYVLKDIRVVTTQSSSHEEFWSTASEVLYSEFEIDENTIIVVYGDRAR